LYAYKENGIIEVGLRRRTRGGQDEKPNPSARVN
jgi:hypothetical protein